MKLLRTFIADRKIWILTWLSGLMLLLQVMNLHTYVASAVEHQAIVAANDDDASWVVAKTVKTRWWKDNGWVLYGPFYFRINHSIQYFWGRTADLNPVTDHENWEKTAHAALMTVSLLSVVGTSLLLGAALLPLWWMRFLFAIAMNAALLSNHTWSEFVLRAHPDQLFTFTIVAALWLTFMMVAKPEEKIWRLLSAIVWGFSVSVKMTLSLCAPGFLLLFVPPFKKANWLSGLRYLGIMLIAYFAIGFPQTIMLARPFTELAVINRLSTAPTSASVLHWLQVDIDQLGSPLLVLLLAWLCFARREFRVDREGWLRLTLFVILPFVVLLGKNMTVPSDHYVMPFAAMLLLMVGFGLTQIRLWQTDRWPVARAIAFMAVALGVWGSTPAAMQSELEKRLVCRDDAREAYHKIFDLYNNGEKIWVDPYVPYLTAADKSRMEVSWEKTWSGFERGGWTVLALNKSYLERYTNGDDPSVAVKLDVPAWKDVREFYMPFTKGEDVVTPSGVHFHRAYQNHCGQEIWVK